MLKFDSGLNIGNFSCEEQAALYRRAMGGCAESRDRLITGMYPLIKNLVYRQYRKMNMSIDDLIQAGMLGVCEKFHKFDVNRGVPYRSFATGCAILSIRNYIRKSKEIVYVPDIKKGEIIKRRKELNKNQDYVEKNTKRNPWEKVFLLIVKEKVSSINDLVKLEGRKKCLLKNYLKVARDHGLLKGWDITDRGKSFISDGRSWFEYKKEIAMRRELMPMCVDVDENVRTYDTTIVRKIQFESIKKVLGKLYRKLAKEDRGVLILAFGLDGSDGKPIVDSFRDLGFSYSKTHCHRIFNEILTSLRNEFANIGINYEDVCLN